MMLACLIMYDSIMSLPNFDEIRSLPAILSSIAAHGCIDLHLCLPNFVARVTVWDFATL